MSRENVELVRRWYDAWNRGDTHTVIQSFAPDVVWHGHPRLPEPGPYGSRDEVERWMAQFREAWGELRTEPVELLDAGDSVIALIHMTGRGRGSGVEIGGGVDVHLITIANGEVTLFRIHPADEVVELAGLQRPEFEALVLRVQEGLSESSIADRLEVEEAEVSATLAGAYNKLRALIPSERVS